jgi:SAM-dependent methyltransferase
MKCLDLQSMTQQQYAQTRKMQLKEPVDRVQRGHVSYTVTDRSFEYIQDKVYPEGWVSDLQPGLQVLDVGTGLGQFVTHLRGKGIHAEGLDLNPQLPDKPYLKQVAFENAPYPPETFDCIYSAYSIFYYPESDEFLKAALQKIACLLKPDGKARLAPIQNTETLKHLLAQVPALRISQEGPDNRYLELTKIGKPTLDNPARLNRLG